MTPSTRTCAAPSRKVKLAPKLRGWVKGALSFGSGPNSTSVGSKPRSLSDAISGGVQARASPSPPRAR